MILQNLIKKQKVKRIWTDEQKQKQLENSKNTINVWLYDMIKNTKEKFLSASKIDNLFNFNISIYLL